MSTTAEETAHVLITLTGRDRPGITAHVCGVLADAGARIADMEQVILRDRLVLGIEAEVDGSPGDGAGTGAEALRDALADLTRDGLVCEVEALAGAEPLTMHAGQQRRDPAKRHHITLLGQPLTPTAIAAITTQIATLGGNIDRIDRLSRYPVLSFELLVEGVADTADLKASVARAAADHGVDVAVQRAGLHRRAKRLVVFDVDSTLVDGEVIELLAEHAGCADAVRDITGRAMAGELDFEQSLRERVALLKGVDADALAHVREHLRLMPGARTVIRTLNRLGYVTAMVSGGFTQVTDDLARELGVSHSHANTLEIVDGIVTGGLVGPIVDRAAKASHLQAIAAEVGIPLSQTVAVGDGANDLDMLSVAGLGIAFNAKPVVQEQAEVAVNVPFLDAVLFLLGITREEIERADADDPAVDIPAPPAVTH